MDGWPSATLQKQRKQYQANRAGNVTASANTADCPCDYALNRSWKTFNWPGRYNHSCRSHAYCLSESLVESMAASDFRSRMRGPLLGRSLLETGYASQLILYGCNIVSRIRLLSQNGVHGHYVS